MVVVVELIMVVKVVAIVVVVEGDTHQPPEQGVALEQALGRLLVEREQLPGGGADEGEAVLDPPHLSS